ncbi:MAG: T9SS type A sorting domain-containing protein [candidate division WOR-3 bacterium]
MVNLFTALLIFLIQNTIEVKEGNGIFYRVFIDQRRLCFQYKLGRNWSQATVLDTGDVTSPSIAITPKDLLHIVWQKNEGGRSRIYYITTLEGITPDYIRSGGGPHWSDKYPISEPERTEPASNPFVEAQGEWVYAVWRGPNEEGNPDYGEIWQRKGKIRPGQLPYWYRPQNMSRTLNNESNYPTMSTGTAVVWQESLPGNYEIYANIITAFGERIVNISNDSTNSFFPHTNLLPAPPWVRPEWRLFTVWTEESIPDTFYRIKFSNYYFSGPPYDTLISPFSISGGDSIPSPYCLARDSFIDFGEIAIDYADSNLFYRLPYLHPQKSYLLQAVVYQDTTGVHRERFLFEDGRGKTVEYYPEESETLGVIIPAGIYDSTITDIEIRKLLGEYSVLAHLNLYEFEMVDKEGGGPQSLWTDEILPYTSLISPFPNPFSRIQRIKYQLAKAGRVLIKVYDISGKEIRVLTNETKEPGIYTDNFDGKDARGRRPPFGIYFIRLKTADFSDTKKVVLTR